MSLIEDIDEVLLIYEVHAGYPVERRALAGRLASDGISIDDLEVLGDHLVAMKERSAVPKVMVKILNDEPKLRRSQLDDLRRVRDRRSAKVNPRFGDKPAAIAPTAGEDKEQWAHDRNCRIAYCCVVADRRPKEAVAKELNVSVKELGAMIERGKKLQTTIIDVATKPPVTQVPMSYAWTEDRHRKFEAAIAWGRVHKVIPKERLDDA